MLPPKFSFFLLLNLVFANDVKHESVRLLRTSDSSNFVQMLQGLVQNGVDQQQFGANQFMPGQFVDSFQQFRNFPPQPPIFNVQSQPQQPQIVFQQPQHVVNQQQQQFMRQPFQPVVIQQQPQQAQTNFFTSSPNMQNPLFSILNQQPQQTVVQPQQAVGQPQLQQQPRPQPSPYKSEALEWARTGHVFNDKNCGTVNPQVTNFVAGGKRMNNHEHPWYAQLIIHNMEFAESETYCGGTLISKEWLLTAAHCYDDMNRDRLARSTKVIFRGLRDHKRHFTARVDLVIIHNEYVPSMLQWEADAQGVTPGPINDLALVHLSMHHVPEHVYARLVPVCVPAPNLPIAENTECRVMGHGFMNKQDELQFRMPSELQGADVRIAANRACQMDVESRVIRDKINAKTCCVRGPIHPCVGDSGGPLVCKGSSRSHIDGTANEDEHAASSDENVLNDAFTPRKWYLVGVTSFAVSTDEHDHCGLFKSAVFGLVSTQLEWIRSTLLTYTRT